MKIVLLKKISFSKKAICFLSILVFYFFSFSVLAEGGEVNIAQLTQAMVQGLPSCSHYKIVGRCFWLQCSAYECHINSTWKLDHYLPDSVITVFRQKGTNPWIYANNIIDPEAYLVAKKIVHSKYDTEIGAGNVSVNSQHDIDNHFKEVDVIGNPAANILSHYNLFLPVQTIPYLPYFSSLLDAFSWRSGELESFYPGTLIPGIHEVGSFPFNDWGNIYPRTGFLDQPSDAKNAAVIAQRAADIVTKNAEPHVYQPLSRVCGSHCEIKATEENNKDTQFQMVYPTPEAQCNVFGSNDTFDPTPWHGDDVTKGNGNYIWFMWRHYRGCIQGMGEYIYSIDWA